MNKLTGVSLFAGVGGFDLAMERNGVEVVANVEIDKQDFIKVQMQSQQQVDIYKPMDHRCVDLRRLNVKDYKDFLMAGQLINPTPIVINKWETQLQFQ